MTRFLIYLFPPMAEIIAAATMFVCSIRVADAGKSKTEVGLVFTSWAAVYIVTNQVLARFVTSRNSAVLMIWGNLFFTFIAIASILITGTWAIYCAMAALAIGCALFFLPFQVFMKAAEPDQHQGVVRSAAMYTFSWSIGFAAGPFIAGFIYQWLGWQWCFAFTGLLGLVIICGIQLVKHHAKYHSDSAPNREILIQANDNSGNLNYHIMPDLAWLEWINGGIGCLGIFALLALLPSVGVYFAIPKSQIGSIIGSLYVVQALVALSLLNGKIWMFRPMPVISFAIFGIIGMALFCVLLLPTFNNARIFAMPMRTLCLYVSVIFYGVFSGSFFFGLVFHSLVHPYNSAKYVAVNETVVGICGAVGPLLAGVMADRFGFIAFPALMIIMITGSAILQFTVLKRYRSLTNEMKKRVMGIEPT